MRLSTETQLGLMVVVLPVLILFIAFLVAWCL